MSNPVQNNLFPITIIDNFYSNPDEVRDMALKEEYKPSENGAWPGERSVKNLDEINENLFLFFSKSILSIFYPPEYHIGFDIVTCFQKITPRHKEKFHPKNMGWIHTDGCLFGGLIYLTKDSEKDTGTSIYTEKNTYFQYSMEDSMTMRNDYLGQSNIADEEYSKIHKKTLESYNETVKIENVYNRCILFGGNNHHSAQSFGTKERLTQVFFCYKINSEWNYPFCRSVF